MKQHILLPLDLPEPEAFILLHATCVQDPGAAPISITSCPGVKSLCLSSISKSLKALLHRQFSSLALFTYGSLCCLCIHLCELVPFCLCPRFLMQNWHALRKNVVFMVNYTLLETPFLKIEKDFLKERIYKFTHQRLRVTLILLYKNIIQTHMIIFIQS